MQTSDRVLAGRYGRALFLAAAEAHDEERVWTDLKEAAQLLSEAMPALRNPRISAADKKKKAQEALGKKVSPLTLRFLGMLIDKKRFDLLPLMTATLGRHIAEKKNIAKAKVLSAKPIPAEFQERLKERLKIFSGKNIELDIRVDPEVIGGMVVRLGDWVLDGSLRGRLRKMREDINGN